jgi:hypothetical protein
MTTKQGVEVTMFEEELEAGLNVDALHAWESGVQNEMDTMHEEGEEVDVCTARRRAAVSLMYADSQDFTIAQYKACASFYKAL